MYFFSFGSFFFSKCAAEQTKAKRQHGKIYHQQHDTLSLAHTCTHSHAHLHVHTRTHTHVSKGGSLAEPTDVWPEGNWPQGFDFDGSDDVEIFFPANRLGFKLDELFRKRKLIFLFRFCSGPVEAEIVSLDGAARQRWSFNDLRKLKFRHWGSC